MNEQKMSMLVTLWGDSTSYLSTLPIVSCSGRDAIRFIGIARFLSHYTTALRKKYIRASSAASQGAHPICRWRPYTHAKLRAPGFMQVSAGSCRLGGIGTTPFLHTPHTTTNSTTAPRPRSHLSPLPLSPHVLYFFFFFAAPSFFPPAAAAFAFFGFAAAPSVAFFFFLSFAGETPNDLRFGFFSAPSSCRVARGREANERSVIQSVDRSVPLGAHPSLSYLSVSVSICA